MSSEISQRLSLADRNNAYEDAGFPLMQIVNDRLEGVWWLGNSYGNKSSYYGAYPGNFLKRVMALFPDKERILHLFSGSLPPGDYTRFDRRDPGDLSDHQSELFSDYERALDFDDGLVRGEAENLSDYFEPGSIDLILSDPPYSIEDAERYGAILVNRRKVVSECRTVLEPGGHLVWLDQVIPMFSNREWKLVGSIGVFISTNHRTRGVFILEKTNG